MYTACIIAVYILGKNIPIPGVVRQVSVLSAESDLMAVVQLVLGSGNEQAAIFALDLTPWMTASIIIQLSSLAAVRNNSRTSAISMQRSIRWLTLIFAVINAFIRSSSMEFEPGICENMFLTRCMVILTMAAGAFAVLWLAEQNKEKGIGGVVCIILVNIIRNIIQITGNALTDIWQGNQPGGNGPMAVGLILILTLGGMIAMIILENGEVRLPVQRVLIDSEMDRDNYFAIKTNPAGMQAMMYVMAFYLVPYYLVHILQLLWPENRMLISVAGVFDLYHPIGLVIYVLMYILIAVALACVQISPSDIADQMKQKGDCIMGIRPGNDTEAYLERIVLHNSIISALILGSFIGVSMSLRVILNLNSDIVMLPVLMMILSGIMQNILAEVRTMQVLDHYVPVLGENRIS